MYRSEPLPGANVFVPSHGCTIFVQRTSNTFVWQLASLGSCLHSGGDNFLLQNLTLSIRSLLPPGKQMGWSIQIECLLLSLTFILKIYSGNTV